MSAGPQGAQLPADGILGGFLRAVELHPERPALVVDGVGCSYAELKFEAGRIAATLDGLTAGQFCAVLGVGTRSVFECILGVLLSGRAYVPLNPAFPLSRTAYMIQASGADVVLVDSAADKLLDELVPVIEARVTFLLPEADDDRIRQLRSRFPDARFLGRGDVSATAREPADGCDAAYLMFTSGSTGKPKGVVVNQSNVRSFVNAVSSIYDFSFNDRFSQMFDLTFDLSVFDMFVCWESGASLWVVPPKSRMAPAAFLRKSELTVWFSVPAVAAFMNQLKMLRPGNFPSLRYSLFCGEPLPATLTEAWQESAPSSIVDNLYGPTELTIACSYYRWNSSSSRSLCVNDVVPIGKVYAGLEAAIVDSRLEPVAPGKDGELCVRGPQTTPGYWQNEALTAEKFVALPGYESEGNRWYRTGDVVRELDGGDMVFVGRVDNQVKIRGYRVELGEIEARLRSIAGTDFAIAVPWPKVPGGGASGIVACLAGSAVDDATILDACRAELPEYMVPGRVLRLERMPLNVNGKMDRNALKAMIEKEDA